MAESRPCKACKAPLLFVPTENGKAMPLDAEPSAGGTIEIRDGVAVVHSVEAAAQMHRPLYRSHFSTCPRAGEFRKPRGA